MTWNTLEPCQQDATILGKQTATILGQQTITILDQQTTTSTFCTTCQECDHSASQCFGTTATAVMCYCFHCHIQIPSAIQPPQRPETLLHNCANSNKSYAASHTAPLNMSKSSTLSNPSSTTCYLSFLYVSVFQFHFSAVHIHSVLNVAADAISQNNLVLLSSLFPQSTRSTVPTAMSEFLLSPPQWESVSWTKLFICSLSTDSSLAATTSSKNSGGLTAT